VSATDRGETSTGGPAAAEGPAPDANMRTDDAIIAGLLGNDLEAIATVARWARAVAAHRAWGFDTCDDLVQATLLAVIQNLRLERFARGNLRAYVRRIAKNICVSSYRRMRTRGVQVSVDESQTATLAADSGKRVVREAMVRRILARLDISSREIIAMAYLEGLSRKEMAARLGISETAAKVRLHRCMLKAREVAAGAGTAQGYAPGGAQ
jgi:RNA polymerase sigma factor (sigma-70 family)